MVARRSVSLLLVLLTSSFLLAQQEPPPPGKGGTAPWGRTTIRPPERTDEGIWDGTWVYVYRGGKWGLWIKTVDGEPQMKMEFHSKRNTEVFETGWDGEASYEWRGSPGTFAITAIRKDDDLIEGTWFWDWQSERAGKTENANITIYRGGDGRQLVFLFKDFEKTIRQGDRRGKSTNEFAWTFQKASKRLVRWEELPH